MSQAVPPFLRANIRKAGAAHTTYLLDWNRLRETATEIETQTSHPNSTELETLRDLVNTTMRSYKTTIAWRHYFEDILRSYDRFGEIAKMAMEALVQMLENDYKSCLTFQTSHVSGFSTERRGPENNDHQYYEMRQDEWERLRESPMTVRIGTFNRKKEIPKDEQIRNRKK